MLGKEAKILPEPSPYGLHELYDKYSGMLYGYIFEVVKDASVAEKYLIDFYSELPKHIHEINAGGTNTWGQLQRMVKRYLSKLLTEQNVTNQVAVTGAGNRFLGLLNDEQKQVFYNIYYGGKSASQLAYSLNKTEDAVRKSLKEAFLILRSKGER